MKKGFYTIIAAQFTSSLADNALLIAAIALLSDRHAVPWLTPLLQLFFSISYVLLAPFVGAFSDSMPKGRVMLLANTLKAVGCLLMLFGLHPILAYGIVGVGAAAYSPAKYGILTELLPARDLVKANGWIEAATVGSTIIGTVLGGALVAPAVGHLLGAWHVPLLDTAARGAMFVVMVCYAAAALINIGIPDTGARYPARALSQPMVLAHDFAHAFRVLWHDRLAQIVLAVTTMLWGAAVTLQLLVLKWAQVSLGTTLSGGAVLQSVIGIGLAAGAALAATRLPLRRSMAALPVGIVTGFAIIGLAFFNRHTLPTNGSWYIGDYAIPFYMLAAYPMMAIIGALSGFFVVPMNAVLQHRGHMLLSAGHSIAVQNFNQNIAVLLMLGLYAVMLQQDIPIPWIISFFGVVICLLMAWMMLRHARNVRLHNVNAVLQEAMHDTEADVRTH
ncbi:major facilitator transporter [Robbsia andropogonis]|uniref:Major facilitator transporter n=1 Tax=Robbsia andropogonis TaxID=28092 RepID=A0A0F5JUV9_9BURK|nr:lysophospholipid transporter LplT [Robbsia andropogonis]KKB61429.1 major facilitator transporter [Robbsia andropogonis]MCP1120188.1 lysophospholipid transporter LplT [Robbsia andropogonis]MCP1129980.1 lysophospholipid transporter LplT [Robbsia andropogonis]